jgi:hypothetical protein
VSQDRLRGALVAAVAAAKASPDWRDGDELCVILADADDTVMSSQGFRRTVDLARLLEFHAHKLRQAK